MMTDKERIEAIMPVNDLEKKIKEYILAEIELTKNDKWALHEADKYNNDDLLSYIECNIPKGTKLDWDKANAGNHTLNRTDLTYNEIVGFMNNYNLMP